MKLILKIFLIITLSFCAEYYSSLYGSGEKIITSNPSNISLGWSNLFSSNNHLNTDNLSNFFMSESVRLSVSTNFNFSTINNKNYYKQKLNYFGFLVPIKENKLAVGVSISPYYRINSNIIENDYSYFAGNINESPLAYKSEYFYNGGPSVAEFLFSSKINDKLSFGISFEYIFGSLYTYVKHNIYNINYNIDEEISYTDNSLDQFTSIKNFNGYGIKLETSYIKSKNNFIGSINILNNNEITEYFYDDIAPGALEIGGITYNNENTFEFSSPLELNLGYSRYFKNGSIIFEYYTYKPFESEKNILNNPDLSKNKINFGYHGNVVDTEMTFGTGLYYIDSYNENIKSKKFGLTFGMGFNMIRNITLDATLDLGKNSIEISEQLDENYINLYLGISSSDKWFK